MEQLKSIGTSLALGAQSKEFLNHSKEFLDLIKSIGESRSKSEEDNIVLREIHTLKTLLSQPDIPKRYLKEYIIRLLYVEMLGHDASFGYIHAVKITHHDTLQLKRTGYLAVTLFLHENHDLIILIVNTIQKDLKSDNYLVICAALNAVCKLINEDTIPAVLPQVVELLSHPKEAVRKKAVMALHRFYLKSPSSVSHLVSNFRKRLSDSDPGVMGAALCPLFDLITIDPNSYKELVISFVNILKQVAERRLPKTYDYHQMPAPFIQVKLLKILALLGSGDKQASENLYTVLGDIIRKSDSSTNIGNAVLYECICCVSSIYPNPKLLEAAADVIAKLLKSDSHNLRYMGIDALGRLIKLSPHIAEQHQLAVIDCLEDPDDTLKRKTFELLYKMTKSSNVEVIVDRMIDYMISISDDHYKTYIASQCVELAEQFAPSNHWFIRTMNKVFEHAGDLVNIKVAHNLMRLIAEGFGEDDDAADSQLRSSAVESYLRIIGEPKLPSVFLQVICWVLGEYGTADGKYSASHISGKLCDIVAEAYSNDETVKAYAISALMKIYAFEVAAGRKVDMLPECQSLIEDLLASHSTDLQQRTYELQALIGLDAQAVERIMPRDASCEDIEIFVTGKDLWGHIDGSNPAPDKATHKDEHAKWTVKDAQVMAWILASVDPAIVLNLRPFKIAATMWAYLKKIYSQNNTARRFQLEHEIAIFQQDSLSISEFYSHFMNLWAEYTDIVYADLTSEGLSSVQSVHETAKRDQFLMKLRSEFEGNRSNLMNRDPVPSLDACLNDLFREEQRLLTHTTMDQHKSTFVLVVYATQAKPKGRDMSAIQCFCCKGFGHYASNCPKKFCSYCKRDGHIIKECPTRPPRKFATAFTASVGSSTPSSSANTASVQQNAPAPVQTLTPEMVHTADGNHLPITATGDISSSLTDVFVSPGLTTNLISVGQLVDNDCRVEFSQSGCLVQDQHSGKMIVKGPKVGRLFPLHFPLSPCLSLPIVSCNSAHVDYHTWHKRLGHPNSNVFHDLLKSGFLGNKESPSLRSI